jgi:hypothetical protein
MVAAAVAASGMPATAAGDNGPVFVIPGNPQVPVFINGIEVSGAVVYGDWGLSRPGAPQIYIEGGRVLSDQSWRGTYFPRTGRPPRVGRLEIEPPANRRLPPSPPEFHQRWGAASDFEVPATAFPPPPVFAPPQHYYPRGDQ